MSKIWGLETVALSPVFFNALRLHFALEALKNTHGRVLEIGCGGGAFTQGLKKYRPDLTVVGSDVDRQVLQLARSHDKKGEYVYADAQALPFADTSYAAVVAFDVIEHLPHPEKAFKEIRRVLKHEGIFHGSIPLEASLWTIHGWAKIFGFIPKRIYADHGQQFTYSSIVGQIKRSGLTYLKCSYSGHLLEQLLDFVYFTLLVILRRPTSHTVEGYIQSLRPGMKRGIFALVRSLVSVMIYSESKLLWWLPGQIGHFDAQKL